MHQHPNVVVVGPDGYTEVHDELAERTSNSALAFHKRWWEGVRFFHREREELIALLMQSLSFDDVVSVLLLAGREQRAG